MVDLGLAIGMSSIYLIVALALAFIHFSVPLVYYYHLKSRWLNKPWNIEKDPSYRPKVAIIIPTYNEVEFIRKKLDDIYAQNYPRELVEVIIADSGSGDGTLEAIKEWMLAHMGLGLKLVVDMEKRGKLYALLKALNYVPLDSEIVVFTDVDAFWEPNALSKMSSYFADPNVGSVTACIYYTDVDMHEEIYRNYYNVVRVAESKIYATPVHNGPFLAIKADLLRKYGLPDFPGSDDSSFGSFIAFAGYRAIQVEDIVVREPIRGSQVWRRIRRAHHLIINFITTKKYAKRRGVYKYNSAFERIWRIEWWLHIVNPWLLVKSVILLVLNAIFGSLIALIFIGAGLALLLLSNIYKVWILQQIYLVIAMVRSLWMKEMVWRK
jgi:biofilm PGA synthesis N-glycosyltransferase PgaC